MATRLNVFGTFRLGGDAELKALPDGRLVSEMSGAVENYKGETEWHRISLFGPRAKNLTPYLTKGALIAVTGSPTTPRAWKRSTDNVLVASYDIIANDIQLLSAQNRENVQSETATTPEAETIEFA